MDRIDLSPRDREEEKGPISCWGRLKLKLPWTKRRVISSSSSGNSTTNHTRQRRPGWNVAAAFMTPNRQTRPAGGFRYDPLSYAQNFDDGCWDDDNEDVTYRGFSSRFAPPSRSLEDQHHK